MPLYQSLLKQLHGSLMQNRVTPLGYSPITASEGPPPKVLKQAKRIFTTPAQEVNTDILTRQIAALDTAFDTDGLPQDVLAYLADRKRNCEIHQQVNEHGFHPIDVQQLEQDINALDAYPKYRAQLKRVPADNPDFSHHILNAPRKVLMQYHRAQDCGVFEEYQVLSVEKLPDPILVGRVKDQWYEISRWT